MAQLACVSRPAILRQTHTLLSRPRGSELREKREALMATVQEIVKGFSRTISHWSFLRLFMNIVQCLFFDEIREKRKAAVQEIQRAYSISNKELDTALEVGRRAIREYFNAAASSQAETASSSPPFREYIEAQLNDYKIPSSSIKIVEKWIATPAALEWDIGTAYNSDKGILEDAQVFTVQLSLSKFWMRLLDERSMKAIIDHEIAHLGQNAENLESHMLRALVDEKEKANPPKHGEEKHARKKAWQDYLYWTEYSADQVPALKSIDKARGMRHFLGSLLMSVEVFNSPFHPANWRRQASIQDILSSLEAEQWLLTKKVCRNCEEFKRCQTQRSYYEKHLDEL